MSTKTQQGDTTDAVRLFRRGEDGQLTDVRINGHTAVWPSASEAQKWVAEQRKQGNNEVFTIRACYATRYA